MLHHPRDTLDCQGLHGGCGGREGAHGRHRHCRVGEGVDVLPIGLWHEGGEPKRRGGQLQVADEQLGAGRLRPLALAVEELAADHRPGAVAGARHVLGGVGVDGDGAAGRRRGEAAGRREGHALVLRVVELGRPASEALPSGARRGHTAAPQSVDGARAAPRCVQPLPTVRVELRSEGELSQQAHVLRKGHDPLGRGLERDVAVAHPLGIAEVHAPRVEIELDAEKLHRGGWLLLLGGLEPKSCEHVPNGLEVKGGACHVAPVTNERRARRVEEEVVDTPMACVVDVHSKGVEARPALLNLLVLNTERPRPRAAGLQPREDDGVTRRELLVNGAKRFARSVDQEVRYAAALRRIGGAAKATALIDKHAVDGEGAVATPLRLHAAHLLVESNQVEHPCSDRRARLLEDREGLRHLAHLEHLGGRPCAAIHSAVQRRHVPLWRGVDATVWPRTRGGATSGR